MTDDEIAEFIDHSRTATLATVSPGGRPHLVAMWYAVLDGEIWFETKAKSQKAVNLRRDSTVTVMIDDGQTYDTLRGVSIDGRAEIVDDPDSLLRVGISVWERYTGPYSDDMRPYVEELSRLTPHLTLCYPNAGLPNEIGQYDDTPAHKASVAPKTLTSSGSRPLIARVQGAVALKDDPDWRDF